MARLQFHIKSVSFKKSADSEIALEMQWGRRTDTTE
jgi:hypothetical protein